MPPAASERQAGFFWVSGVLRLLDEISGKIRRRRALAFAKRHGTHATSDLNRTSIRKCSQALNVSRNSTHATSGEISRTIQSRTSGGRPPVQIFAAKHTFVRNARLRSIILVGWAVLYGIVRVAADDMPQ